MSKKNVLHLKVGDWIVGGIEALVINVHEQLKETYIFDLYAITYTDQYEIFPYMQSFLDNGSKIGSFKRGAFHTKHCWNNIDCFFQTHHYDIVHIHVWQNGERLARIFTHYAKKNRIKKVIYHSHSTEKNSFLKSSFKDKVGALIIPMLIRDKPDILLACSDMAGERAFGKKPFDFVRNGIDLNKFKYNQIDRQKIRDEFKIDDDTFVIGHIGRMDDNKNQTFLLDVFNLVLKEKPNSKLLLVGDGETRQILEEKVSVLGIENSVIFTGTRYDANSFYSAFDCFVLPSFFEGLGIVLIEAQCEGVPCVSAQKDVPIQAKIREQFKFIPLDAPHFQWVDAIMKVCQMPNNRERAYLEEEVQKWSIQDTANHFKQIYEE